nr:alpha/beta hydrolase [Streptomyces sp. NBC_00995]
MSGRFTAGDGTVLAYDDLGAAGAEWPPVVLVHGHPFDRGMWQPQATALVAAGYRVILPDLRGYGESGVVPGRTLFGVFAADIAALLDHLGVARAVVCGVSMGGQIAMEFHRALPDRVAALVLADTSPVAETEDGKAFRNRLADRLLAEGMGGYADEVIDKMLASYNVTGQPDVAERVLRMMRATAPEGAAAALRGRAERPDYRASLAGAGVPVLVVVGADDVYTPVAEARALHGLIPGAELVVVEEAGHLPCLERPGAFNDAMVRFLAGVRKGGRP